MLLIYLFGSRSCFVLLIKTFKKIKEGNIHLLETDNPSYGFSGLAHLEMFTKWEPLFDGHSGCSLIGREQEVVDGFGCYSRNWQCPLIVVWQAWLLPHLTSSLHTGGVDVMDVTYFDCIPKVSATPVHCPSRGI